jgi:CheY-like chemotaxis protein
VNLAINARDAMPGGGRVTIRTATVSVSAGGATDTAGSPPPGQYVTLTVSDTGVGIPRDQLARVFEPFYTTKELGKGTGLGLSTLYGIIRQLEGFIGVESEEGRGTTFTIHLPRATGMVEEEQAAEPVDAGANLGGVETILVAEDEAGVRSLLSRILRAHGYTVLEARDGADALRVSARHDGSVDLLITDLVMPMLGGIALSEGLQAARSELRVLFISGYTDNEIGRRGPLPAGAAFLQKPFAVQALLHAVRTALDG